MSHGIAVHEHSRRTTRQYPLLILHEWSDPDRLHAFYIWSFAFGYHAVAYNASERLSAHSTLLSASTSTGTSSTRLPARLLLLRLPARLQRVYRNVFYFYVYRHVFSASTGTSSASTSTGTSTARLPERLLLLRHQHVYSTSTGTSTARLPARHTACLLPDLLRSESSAPGATQPSHDAATLEYDSATPEPATESSFESPA